MLNGQLPVFPSEGVAVSITVTVWVGVCVVVFFNLRLGWTLSGLVVPGYVVPLILVKPGSAVVILIESVVTYLAVAYISERFRTRPNWSSLFGRDRFLAIVLVSILVRACGDGWLIPFIARWLNDQLHISLDYRNDLHSYGLIVVSLIANYFWKPGLWRGGLTLAVNLFLTYVIVRYGFIQWTNFNLGNLHYLYEDVSTSLLASPKAYIFVVTTAYIASWMNLRYSWEYGGILIPALLALLWHEPSKILISFVEAAWILVLARALLRLPVWRNVTMEGGRRLLLFFTVAAAHRLALAHLLPNFTRMPITDAFGFGYLLTTLLAVRAHEKQITCRIFRATAQVSMMGAVLGSAIGFAISLFPTDRWTVAPQVPDRPSYQHIVHVDRPLRDLIEKDAYRLYRQKNPDRYEAPLHLEMQRFSAAIKQLRLASMERSGQRIRRAHDLLAEVNYDLIIVGKRHAYLREREPERGWGSYVLDLHRTDGLLVSIPAPLTEPGTLAAGLSLYDALDAHTLAISGTSRRTNGDGSSDMLTERGTMLAVFHRLNDPGDVLQVRGHTVSSVMAFTGRGRSESRRLTSTMASSLWIRRCLPPSLNLRRLRSLVHGFDVHWRDTPTRNSLREISARGFGELRLSRDDLQRLRIRPSRGESATPKWVVTEGFLESWLNRSKDHVARRSTDSYRTATVEEMLLLDSEILTPLISFVRRHKSFSDVTPEQQRRFLSIDRAAQTIDYRILPFHDLATGAEYVVLTEQIPRQRNWGTYVFRLGLRSSYVVEIPRPLYERRSHEFGTGLFERFQGAALLIAGAHPHANHDGSADVTRLHNRINAFCLVRQVLLRELLYRPLLIVQSRAIQAPVEVDVLMATEDGSWRDSELSDLAKNLHDQLRYDGMEIRLVDGTQQTAGYELGIILQSSSLNHSLNKQMIGLWIAPTVRRFYRRLEPNDLQAAQFAVVGIETVQADLARYVSQWPIEEPTDDWPPPELLEELRAYVANQDVVRLWRIRSEWPNVEFTRVLDESSGQPYLVFSKSRGTLPTALNLNGSQYETSRSCDITHTQAIRDYIRSRATWLKLRVEP